MLEMLVELVFFKPAGDGDGEVGNHVGPISYHKPHHLGIVSIHPSIPGKSELD
jgi:hypothetical protein